MSQRRGRHRYESSSHGSQDRWLVSYADFITLLFAFFTTLYAISTVDAKKLDAMRTGLQAAFATVPDGHTSAIGTGDAIARALRPPAPPAGVYRPLMALTGLPRPLPPSLERELSALPESTLASLRNRLGTQLADDVQEGRVELDMDRRGLVISIREAGSFETGSAELSPVTRELLAEIAAPLRDVGNLLRVEGHTDNVPIHTAQYASNWELSTARATGVVAFLIEEMRMEAVRLSAAGYSEFHPRAPNDDAANRSRNRRVDIVVLNPTTSDAEEPASGSALP
jgi:chemotaxis protein MotB